VTLLVTSPTLVAMSDSVAPFTPRWLNSSAAALSTPSRFSW
jgi:hypothetical protein